MLRKVLRQCCSLHRPLYAVPRLYGRLCSSPSETAATTISIDHSSLYNLPEHSDQPSSDSELVKHLKGIIKFRLSMSRMWLPEEEKRNLYSSSCRWLFFSV
ncbi:hypothetical protein Fmac_030374 [Flemingia macrophylla]|uniref:Uncharacterized protein n=1 Tax=Flemingia macrophylla TaxID=520843 RepID=A0ABD1LD05_9FABA